MPVSPEATGRKLGRLEKVFFLGLALYLPLRWAAPASPLTAVFPLALYIIGVVLLFRFSRVFITRILWRLRNRLMIAYLFIAVVPVVLILALAGLSVRGITGQMASYIINTELERRTGMLRHAAHTLVRTPAPERSEALSRLGPFLSRTFPNVEVLIDGDAQARYPASNALAPPPAGWEDAAGVVVREGRIYCWAHAVSGAARATITAPLTHEFLTGLASGLGSISLVTTGSVPGAPPRIIRLDETKGTRRDRIPPPSNWADIEVPGYYPFPIMLWERPGESENVSIYVQTRLSAVLSLVLGHNLIGERFEVVQAAWWLFLLTSGMFLIMEIASLIIGVSITRTITTAVHELYQGTERVKEGDFSHRIPVRGNDQLAELGVSFNTMTANLERLIVVAKEKERLQSELEIAREVQNQLFPRAAPDLKSLRLTGICNPARTVSGDYYDFMPVLDTSLAFAIGDVAGKGISAALLMAAIQSATRTQLATGVPAAAAAGNGGGYPAFSTARLVSMLNKQLYANTSPEKFATFYFALYDDLSSTLTYTNAGHLPPILVRNGCPEELEVTGTVVGAFPFSEYEEKRIQLVPGDVLVAYTDGVTEPENEYGEMFGEARLKDLLVRHAASDGGEIIARVMEAVTEWSGGGELQDDMTMLVARRI